VLRLPVAKEGQDVSYDSGIIPTCILTRSCARATAFVEDEKWQRFHATPLKVDFKEAFKPKESYRP